jgi:hypothetical protein
MRGARLRHALALGAVAIVPPLVASADPPGVAPAPAASAATSSAASTAPSTSTSPSTSAPPPTSSAAPPPSGHGHWVYVDETSPSASASAAPPAAASAVPPPAGSVRGIFEPPSTTWDLNLEGAIGWYASGGAQFTGFLRARPGVIFIRDPLYFTVGPTYDWSPISPATFGVQGEILHLDKGLWAQIGGLLDTHARAGVDVAVGLSLLGLEGQYRSYEGIGSVFAGYVKLRLPIGILVHALSRRAQHEEELRTRNGAQK